MRVTAQSRGMSNANEDNAGIIPYTGAIGEGTDILGNAHSGRSGSHHTLGQAVEAILLFGRIYGFGDAVAVENQGRAVM